MRGACYHQADSAVCWDFRHNRVHTKLSRSRHIQTTIVQHAPVATRQRHRRTVVNGYATESGLDRNVATNASAVQSIGQPSSTSSYAYDGEHNFNLSEYMVALDKPIGLTIAPDPTSGQIVVQHVAEDSPAAATRLIQVGDVLKKCSAVFGDDMWQCRDIRRVKWAILNRSGQVKLILERSNTAVAPIWYTPSKQGMASAAHEVLQLPLKLGPIPPEGPPSGALFQTVDEEGAGGEGAVGPKVMRLAFHRHFLGPQQRNSRGLGAAARAARTKDLRTQLAAAREEPPISLEPPSHSPDGKAYPLNPAAPKPAPPAPPAPQNNAPKNGAVPFRRSPERAGGNILTAHLMSSLENITRRFSLAPTPSPSTPAPDSAPASRSAALPAKRVVAVLPWLLVSTGRLSLQELTWIASQRGLSSVLELGLQPQGSTRLAIRGTTLPDPPPSPASALITASAHLQRLVKRRGGIKHPLGGRGECTVLLQCEEGMDGEVATLLAAWLHWHRGLGLHESVQAAEQAMAVPIPQGGLLEEATAQLTKEGQERASKVVLTWPYGGYEAKVAGEVVGGWANRLPMRKCWHHGGCRGAARGHFYMEVKGLPPGAYHYKYIIDGTWALDLHAPKALDSSGNWNNVLQVVERPPLTTPEERLGMARLEAAWQSFEAKLGLRCC